MIAAAQTAREIDYRGLIARAVRILHELDLMDMNGHVSARPESDPDTMWINSRRASRSTLTESDVGPVDLRTGSAIGKSDEPPSEFHIHRAIYNRRPDVGGIIHSHPSHIVTLSIVGHALMPCTGVGSFLDESTPVFDDASLINTEVRGEAVAQALGDGPAVVLRGHGVVIVGATPEEALARYVCAEDNARIQYKAAMLGQVRVLRGDELAFVRGQTWTPSIVAKHWHYHEETARRAGALDGLA